MAFFMQGEHNTMTCFVYIIECNGGMFYTGITNNLKKKSN